MKKAKIIEMLKNTGVIMEGHYLLTSGRHSAKFLQCSQLLQHPEHAEKVCRAMAEPYIDREVDTVIGPAMGGVILSYETARFIGARAIFTEPSEGKMVLRRGFRIKQGEKMLVVEDAVSTGGSVRKVIDIIKAHDAETVGIAIMIDRTAGKIDLGVPVTALLTMEIESYPAKDCPLCHEGIPLQKPKG